MRERAADLLDAVGLGENASGRAGIFPAANNSGSRSRARSRTIRASFSRTNRPAISTPQIRSALFELLQKIVREEGKALLLVTHNPAIAEACDWIHEMQDGAIVGSHPRGFDLLVRRNDGRDDLFRLLADAGRRPETAELKRGALLNAVALFASNFRGIFTFLVARLLGPATLGTFLVAYVTTDLISKIGLFGLDNTIIAFIARAEAAGDRARSRALFHLAVWLAVGICAAVAALGIVALQLFGRSASLFPRR